MDKKNRPFIFLGVGILNTLLDFLFYTFLIVIFFQNNSEIWIVGLISGTFALVCAYFTHKLITWRDHPASKLTLIKFIIVTGFGLWIVRPLLLSWFITFTGLYKVIHGIIQPLGFSLEFVSATISFGFMVIIVMIYNYISYDKIVFNKKITNTAREIGSKS